MVGWAGGGALRRGHGHIDTALTGRESAVMWALLLIANEAAGVVPKLTWMAPEKPEPVIVTGVPPAIDPTEQTRAGA
jgi:hypothetical protein